MGRRGRWLWVSSRIVRKYSSRWEWPLVYDSQMDGSTRMYRHHEDQLLAVGMRDAIEVRLDMSIWSIQLGRDVEGY